MDGDVHETAVPVRPDGRNAGNGPRIEHAVANDAEPTRPLGDQHASIGQERDGPWMRESPGDDADPDLVLLGSVEHPWSRAQRRHGYAESLLLLSVAEREHAQQRGRSQTDGMSDSHGDLPGCAEPQPIHPLATVSAASTFL
jgi:hypothetical protein